MARTVQICVKCLFNMLNIYTLHVTMNLNSEALNSMKCAFEEKKKKVNSIY